MTHPSEPFYVADLFCGAGGSSSGAMLALKQRGLTLELVAVNHWGVAVATHQKNHPHAVHYVEDVTQARPSQVVPGGYLDLLMASPECIFHSRARGGKPVSDQGRMAAWVVQRWLTDLDVTTLLVENVPEFVDWGPLDSAGHPIPSKKGLYYQTWQNAIRELGYAFEWQYLNAADYGEATTRTRFFGLGRKDGRRVMFPVPTHKRPDKKARPTLFDDGRLPWRAAREVLDLDHKGRSLLTDPKYRKVPLAEKTRARIARGLLKFNGPVLGQLLADLLDVPAALKDEAVGEGPNPFVVVGRENNVPRGVDEPLQTVTCTPAMQLVTPEVETFVLPQRATNAPRSTDAPLPTITTVARQGLVEGAVKAFVLGQQSGSAARAVSQPLPTIATDGAISVVVPVLSSYNHKTAPHSVEDPVPTITAKDRFALVTPRAVVVGRHSSGTMRSLEDPLPTATTFGIGGMATPQVDPFLLSKHADFGGAGGVPARSVEEPTYTATTAGGGGLVQPEVVQAEPFLVPKLGERDGQAPRVHSVADPMPTVTCVGAGRLVNPDLVPYTQQRTLTAGVVDAALPTLVTGPAPGPALDPISPTLVQLAHTGDVSGRVATTDAPLTTLTTRNNTGLVQPLLDPAEGPALDSGSVLTVPAGFDPRRLVVIDGALFVLDIFFRMLKNAELAAAMGFSSEDLTYEFSGTQTDVTKQIGNAVSVRTARALVGAILDSPAVAEHPGVADAAG